MKQLMLGSAALARGAYEAGCSFVSAYPDALSSDIIKHRAEYSEIRSQSAPNETVAFQSAMGASLAGARAMSVMSGLNVAADALRAAARTGVNGGLVIAVADDPEDSLQQQANAAGLPVFVPSDAADCLELAKLAFERSEELDRPVILQLLAQVAASKGDVEQGERAERELIPYRKRTDKYVLFPENDARTFCLGCPHRGVFYVLNKLWLRVIGDPGCSTIAALPPFLAMDSAWCTGASIATLGGLHATLGEKSLRDTVAVIEAPAFCHSGMAGLLDLVNNVGAGTVLILDNGTATVGGKPRPFKAPLSLEMVCEGLGVGRISVVDPFELELLERTVRQELAADEVSVIICRRDCALLSKTPADFNRYEVYTDRCRGCRSCFKLGCPAIIQNGRRATIDSKKCVGCGLCSQLCKCDAIRPLRNGMD